LIPEAPSRTASAALLALLSLAATSGAARADSLLEGPYPLEIVTSSHPALLHWIDSLTGIDGPGMTAGKTWLAHREEYRNVFGPPQPADVAWLERYLRARDAYLGSAERRPLDLTLAFYAAPDLDAAIASAGELLPEPVRIDFAGAIRHFAPKHRAVWNDGEVPKRFLASARAEPKLARRLARFLAGVADFYDVDPGEVPRPVLVLVPVPDGHGTHAQAVGRFLLVEVRPGEGLRDQVAPIVHENAHFVWLHAPHERRDGLAAHAWDRGGRAREAWALLQEALPTAIAQGVADERLGTPGWSPGRPWYHDPSIDAYAKRIYPAVRRALASRRKLDRALLDELLEAYDPSRVSGS
jgi:hypothetical protein